jgi:hypothetical protein
VEYRNKTLTVWIISAVTMTFCGYNICNWLKVLTREDAINKYNMPIPEKWRLVFYNHGVREWTWGTIREHPIIFIVLCMLFAVSLILWLLTTITLKYPHVRWDGAKMYRHTVKQEPTSNSPFSPSQPATPDGEKKN